ncbi:TolC family protein [Sphingomonas bacterium]|uniref:TolC family protein n=1 Tax=Sphingomonas bacterium TaxID=1895847 RepID=UPI001575F7AB|nr:TolC family protein [Sphingomonas bacterium]
MTTTTRNRLRRIAAGAALAGLLAGCSVTPHPMTAADDDARAQSIRANVTAHQEPVTAPIDLYEAMARALKYNLDYRVEQRQQALKGRELNLSTYDMLPQLVASGGYFGRSNEAGASSLSLLTQRQSLEPSTSTDRDVASGDLTLSWDVLDFGLSYVRAKQKADGVLIAAEERRKVSNRIIEDVRTAYYRAVSAQRLLTQLTQLQTTIAATLENSEALAQRRKSPPLIALTYQRELIEIEAQTKSLGRELRIAKTQLAALMNLDPGTDYELVLPPREAELPTVALSADEEVMTALRNRPELREVGYQQRINKHELDSQILAMFPSLKGFVGINADSNGFLYNSHWAQYGAKSAFNLINVFRLGAVKKTVHAQDDVLRSKELATAMAVMTQVQVARARYGLYASELATARHGHAVQARIMGQIDGGFKAGAISEQTQLRERMNTLVSEVRYDIAYADAQNAYANLYAAMGIDSFTPEVTDRQSVHGLAGALQAMWAQRAVAMRGN